MQLEIALKILPVIVMIGLGAALRAFGFLSLETSAGFKKTAIDLTLPIVIFLSLLEMDFKLEYMLMPVMVFVITGLLLFAGMGIKKLLKVNNPYFPALFTSFENGMIGYGVIAVMFGQDNIFPIVLMDMGQTIFFALIFVSYMKALNSGKRQKAGELVMSFLKNPYVWASTSGVLLNVTGAAGFLKNISMFNMLLETAGLLGGLTTPMMCLVIGCEMKIDARNLKKPLAVAIGRLALLLVSAFLFSMLVDALWPGLDSIFRVSIYAMFMLPPFFVGAVLIKEDAVEEKRLALNVTSINILLFLLLFPPLAAYLT
ncbi:MAG: hypothetical protein LBT59_19730 [Clostridiales bacterium]|jgi:predicted permease|nr:hypothetical protein [Clostridiales bacterium]